MKYSIVTTEQYLCLKTACKTYNDSYKPRKQIKVHIVIEVPQEIPSKNLHSAETGLTSGSFMQQLNPASKGNIGYL